MFQKKNKYSLLEKYGFDLGKLSLLVIKLEAPKKIGSFGHVIPLCVVNFLVVERRSEYRCLVYCGVKALMCCMHETGPPKFCTPVSGLLLLFIFHDGFRNNCLFLCASSLMCRDQSRSYVTEYSSSCLFRFLLPLHSHLNAPTIHKRLFG